MIKLVGLLKRKAGISRDDFITYYEMHHVPLTMQLTAIGYDFRRNYPRPAYSTETGQSAPEYDVITELWFTSQQAYEEFEASMRLPPIKARLAFEEERFLDRARSRTFLVDEFITEAAQPGVRR